MTSTTPTGETGPTVLSKNAINQVFTLFRLNYHNQYFKAYGSQDELNYAKKLWHSALREFDDATVMAAAELAIKESEFLPTVRGILKYCERSRAELGLPSPREAYLEACRAPTPKAGHAWSHPAVYWAGHDSDWFFLANNSEHAAFPVFERHYQRYCRRVLAGETLPYPQAPPLPPPADEPLSIEQQRKRLADLRRKTGL